MTCFLDKCTPDTSTREITKKHESVLPLFYKPPAHAAQPTYRASPQSQYHQIRSRALKGLSPVSTHFYLFASISLFFSLTITQHAFTLFLSGCTVVIVFFFIRSLVPISLSSISLSCIRNIYISLSSAYNGLSDLQWTVVKFLVDKAFHFLQTFSRLNFFCK